MLRLLTESETAVRRSGNARLAVETLLLRWTLMDRTVDLAAVLAGGRSGRRPAGPAAPQAAPRGEGGAQPRLPRCAAARERACRDARRWRSTVDALLAAWETDRRARSRTGELSRRRPGRLRADRASTASVVRAASCTEDNPMYREALDRQSGRGRRDPLRGRPAPPRAVQVAPPAAAAAPPSD